ncbi:zinc finger, CCHC-type containing protein [Tanacetum coccineum]
MASSITRFDIEKFDGKNDFGLWQIKMRALMVQQGCDAGLETLPADMKAGEKATLVKKAYDTLILCMRNQVLREVTKETTAAGIWTKGRSDRSSKAHSGGSSGLKSRGGTSKLKCFICYSEGHLKKDCPMKKSSGFVKKGERDQDSDSSDAESNAYFGEALVVVGNDEMAELVITRHALSKGHGKLKITVAEGSILYRMKSGVNIMLTGVPGQEGAEGNVAENKKVKESMEANLKKLLKYNA